MPTLELPTIGFHDTDSNPVWILPGGALATAQINGIIWGETPTGVR